ncbi:transketolase [Arcanobacterium buesumense]|uniref:Transketolase n=1 Tax=Arcanobacterium buesumense TaxID=2722751 RepID=A0A6H2EL04_9ACTO|nr:transketolase [Arcanobacterium buesumense]QJC21783.1 transketolase [Arcanobacterium buesumense]
MTSLTWTNLDDQALSYGRVLAGDAVQKAGNGHPGTAISLAPVAYLLFQKIMRHDPKDPHWLGRDRFVLSIGHSSLTLYTQLFYSGYGLEMDDLKALRTFDSQTPGHPEYGWTPGVEMTTGPLGQGLASAVGMAMAARRERGLLDPSSVHGASPFDHFVYVLCGEGDLQEGVTSEASSLAGTQKLGNLIVIFDDNQISIEDDTVIAFNEDVLARYEAYGWHTQHVQWRKDEGYDEDLDALYEAIGNAQKETERPSIIKLSTIIAWPSPTKQNTGASHGSALGEEELRGLKQAVGIDPEASFQMPDEVLTYVRSNAASRASQARQMWDKDFATWQEGNPDKAALLQRLQARELPQGWEESLPTFESGTSIATRAASGKVLTALKDVLPELWGGSADLAGSNNTTMVGEPSFLPQERSSKAFPGHKYGRTLHFGIREHAMGSILNGIALHGLTRPYGGTFFVFSDYMRPAVRLAALMHVPSIFVWSHDSVGVGEDGPTHQPIEHLWSYRAIPGLDIVRPADANETAYAWRGILERDANPSGIILSRQNLPVFERGEGLAHGNTLASAAGVLRGGYVLADAEKIDVVLIATGSEVSVALEARELLATEDIGARVVSMPCIEWFEAEDAEYRESVLPHDVKARVSVEAGSTFGWKYIVGDTGCSVGIDHYGASASGNFLMKEYGITAENVVAAAKESMSR